MGVTGFALVLGVEDLGVCITPPVDCNPDICSDGLEIGAERFILASATGGVFFGVTDLVTGVATGLELTGADALPTTPLLGLIPRAFNFKAFKKILP